MPRYDKSLEWLKLAENRIPLGSQTFSKSYTQYPIGVSPHFAERAKGSHIWDIDGNKYIDLVNSLAAITLGYCDKGVNKAVKKQLKKGVIFSLPGRLEFEVAEKIAHLVPSAEMVRFAKNGTDATSGAIRLARAYTGRDHVALCGYHGWQDWSISTTSRNKGIPRQTSDYSHSFTYNNFASLEKLFDEFPGQIAAVIMEPMNVEFPENKFLEKVREITERNGTVLIFDETITGFRFSEGGAQEEFNVIPDLTTLGKGIANGFPISAVTGRREIMKEMSEIFFSGTFGGELLSLAAANHVLEGHIERKIVTKLKATGTSLTNLVENHVKVNSLQNVLKLSGHPTWKILQWSDSSGFKANEIKTFFLQEMFTEGVLIIGSHNISTSHDHTDLRLIGKAYEGTLKKISDGLHSGNLNQLLKGKPLEPLFTIR